MANTQYALHLKGFVGGADFDRNYVDYVLAQHVGKPVNVLIDSLGGSVATALSIASAFRKPKVNQRDGSFGLLWTNPDVDVLSFESFFVSLHCWNGFGG